MEAAFSFMIVLFVVISSLVKAAKRNQAAAKGRPVRRMVNPVHDIQPAAAQADNRNDKPVSPRPSDMANKEKTTVKSKSVSSASSANPRALSALSAKEMRRAVILSEVLGKPVSLRDERQ